MVDGLDGDFGGNLGVSTRFEKVSAALDLVVLRKITTCLSLGLVRLIYEEVKMGGFGVRTMIQIGGLSTFSPLAALKIKSFFNGSKEGILMLENLEGSRRTREMGGDGARVSWGPARRHRSQRPGILENGRGKGLRKKGF